MNAKTRRAKKTYEDINRRLRALSLTFFLNSWEEEHMPPAARTYRSGQLVELSSMAYELQTGRRYMVSIENLYADRENLDPVLRHEVEEAKLNSDKLARIPKEEYLAYHFTPTQENASEYITRTLEDNLPFIVGSPTYADYIATRPRAERIGSHGLFTSGDKPINLSKVSEELNNHQGNVWVLIASLKREDAERLGFDNASRWKDMIGGHVAQMASALNIPIEHLKWYGAFHNEGNHPHVHIMIYSTNPKEGYINRYGIDKLRSS